MSGRTLFDFNRWKQEKKIFSYLPTFFFFFLMPPMHRYFFIWPYHQSTLMKGGWASQPRAPNFLANGGRGGGGELAHLLRQFEQNSLHEDFPSFWKTLLNPLLLGQKNFHFTMYQPVLTVQLSQSVWYMLMSSEKKTLTRQIVTYTQSQDPTPNPRVKSWYKQQDS